MSCGELTCLNYKGVLFVQVSDFIDHLIKSSLQCQDRSKIELLEEIILSLQEMEQSKPSSKSEAVKLNKTKPTLVLIP